MKPRSPEAGASRSRGVENRAVVSCNTLNVLIERGITRVTLHACRVVIPEFATLRYMNGESVVTIAVGDLGPKWCEKKLAKCARECGWSAKRIHDDGPAWVLREISYRAIHGRTTGRESARLMREATQELEYA